MLTEKEWGFFRHVIEEKIPFNRFIGLKVVEAKEGFVVLKILFRPEFIGDPRRPALHGGLTSMILDSVGGAAGMTTLRSTKDRLATIDLRVDYLQPGDTEDLFAEGKIVKSGNRIIFTHMIAFQGDHKRIVAEGRGVYHVRRIGHLESLS